MKEYSSASTALSELKQQQRRSSGRVGDEDDMLHHHSQLLEDRDFWPSTNGNYQRPCGYGLYRQPGHGLAVGIIIKDPLSTRRPFHPPHFDATYSLSSLFLSPPPPTKLFSSFSPSPELRSQFLRRHCTRGFIQIEGGLKPSFITGLDQFLAYCMSLEDYVGFGKIRSPCSKCKCTKYKTIDEVRVDLLRKGFMRIIKHGGRPRKKIGVPLYLGDAEVGTSTSPVTSTPVIPTSSLSDGGPAMRMIPTPGSRVQSSETPSTRSQRQTPTQTTTEDDEPPPPEPDSMPWPPVDNPLPEEEEEEKDIAMEEELARQDGRVYLRWDGGNR
ncbi:hypothetical protein PIB30_009436 [Stylosanthes scabra]|uniref:Transposase-associated domain-containing protein n=1 Tax=Stylosanthes scabra TaxID=79078 RepID=A0ABU6X3Y9_9FABA|nr:hypothetical protein [Stylosanthes scabra]